MKKIRAEEAMFFYFTASDDLPHQDQFEYPFLSVTYPIQEFMVEELKRATDFRLVVFQFERVNKACVSYLYWIEDVDLAELDEKVENGTYTDEDFLFAVLTEPQMTFCSVCNWKGKTLRESSMNSYPGTIDLYHDKRKKLTLTQHFLKCPNCGADLRQPVLKIFD